MTAFVLRTQASTLTAYKRLRSETFLQNSNPSPPRRRPECRESRSLDAPGSSPASGPALEKQLHPSGRLVKKQSVSWARRPPSLAPRMSLQTNTCWGRWVVKMPSRWKAAQSRACQRMYLIHAHPLCTLLPVSLRTLILRQSLRPAAMQELHQHHKVHIALSWQNAAKTTSRCEMQLIDD